MLIYMLCSKKKCRSRPHNRLSRRTDAMEKESSRAEVNGDAVEAGHAVVDEGARMPWGRVEPRSTTTHLPLLQIAGVDLPVRTPVLAPQVQHGTRPNDRILLCGSSVMDQSLASGTINSTRLIVLSQNTSFLQYLLWH
jgi:hypothetical protein